MIKRNYLNRDEKNIMMSIMAVAQLIEGVRSLTGKERKPLWIDWKERNFLTKVESKYIKMAHTYMIKFFKEVMSRLDERENDTLLKQLIKFDFKIVDDFTIQKIFRGMGDKMVNAVVPRQQFENICEEIMLIKCKDCNKESKDCKLRIVFEDNFVPDGGFNLDSCRYAYNIVTLEKRTGKKYE